MENRQQLREPLLVPGVAFKYGVITTGDTSEVQELVNNDTLALSPNTVHKQNIALITSSSSESHQSGSYHFSGDSGQLGSDYGQLASSIADDSWCESHGCTVQQECQSAHEFTSSGSFSDEHAVPGDGIRPAPDYNSRLGTTNLHHSHSRVPQSSSHSSYSVNERCPGNTSERFSTSSEESDPLSEIEPSIGLLPNFDPHVYLGNLKVEFIDLEGRVFEKHQSRKGKKARQMIVEGKIRINVTSERPVEELRVWVKREARAADLCGDKNNETELKKPTCVRHTVHNQWLFVIDLDSVYDGKERPVYELAKVEMNERNLFQLVAQVIFCGGEMSTVIPSKPFLIRTLKKSSTDESLPVALGEKRQRPHTWQHLRRKKPARIDDLTASPPSSSSSDSIQDYFHLDKVVVDHLEAQRAYIKELTFDQMLQTRRGDIAYHFRLSDDALDKPLHEGVVVGFFASHDGKTKIEPLSSENAKSAVTL